MVIVVKTAEEFRSSFVMNFGRSARVNVERDTEPLERIFNNAVVSVDDILRSKPFSFSFNSDRHTMFIATTNH